LTNLIYKSIEEKERIAFKLIHDVQEAKEIIFINDNGCIITPKSEIVNWFDKILSKFIGSDRITFCLASSFRIYQYNILHKNNLYYLKVPELDNVERISLLRQYSQFEELELGVEDLRYFSNLLTGFPEQVFYTVELIKDAGLPNAKKNTYLIVDFINERVTQLLLNYEKDDRAFNFLHLLSSYDYISYDFVFEIVEPSDFYRDLLVKFFNCAICEHLGANREYIRVNDAIRDYVLRLKHDIAAEFKKKIKIHLENFLNTYKSEEKDSFDVFISMKEALLAGVEIDDKYLIPSHFLHTMKELYDIHKRYDDIVRLAERVLRHEEFMDSFIVFQIRYYLCLALAKMRDSRFTKEVMKIEGSEHNFLMGFYYRQLGKNTEAIERLNQALTERNQFPRAKRELVQAYINIEEYHKALDLAEQNYDEGKNNPYHIQAYFTCLIRSENHLENEKKIGELLKNLNKINSDKAKEMYLESNALYLAINMKDEINSFDNIDSAIEQFPYSPYPLIAKFEICERFKKIDLMKNVISKLDKLVNKKSNLYNVLLIRKATYYAYINEKSKALDQVAKLRNCPEHIKDKVTRRIDNITKC
ncbi:MAG: tetratricopeptide repeat protein, partial [Candidatus Heimdallarchaeaceae archaeon]